MFMFLLRISYDEIRSWFEKSKSLWEKREIKIFGVIDICIVKKPLINQNDALFLEQSSLSEKPIYITRNLERKKRKCMKTDHSLTQLFDHKGMYVGVKRQPS